MYVYKNRKKNRKMNQNFLGINFKIGRCWNRWPKFLIDQFQNFCLIQRESDFVIFRNFLVGTYMCGCFIPKNELMWMSYPAGYFDIIRPNRINLHPPRSQWQQYEWETKLHWGRGEGRFILLRLFIIWTALIWFHLNPRRRKN